MDKIFDQRGRMIGFTQTSGNNKTYFDAGGKVVSRVNSGRTYDEKGAFKGPGDQGLRILGEKKSK